MANAYDREMGIIRVMVQGRYRKCQYNGARGTSIYCRVLEYERVTNVPSEYRAQLSQVHPEDRDMCVDPNYKIGEFALIFKRDIRFSGNGKTLMIREGKSLKMNNMLIENGKIIVFSPKYGEMQFPEDAVEIVSQK